MSSPHIHNFLGLLYPTHRFAVGRRLESTHVLLACQGHLPGSESPVQPERPDELLPFDQALAHGNHFGVIASFKKMDQIRRSVDFRFLCLILEQSLGRSSES